MSTLHDGNLDEGTIHAWLDGALGAAESAAVRDHVSACARCASAVAEARGLIAGASRIVRALDDVPATAASAGIGTASAPAAPATGVSVWRLLRVTPSRAAIAATILVAAGVFATRKELARESGSPVRPLDSSAVARAVAPASQSATAAISAVTRDSVLQSAIKRRLAMTQPPRSVERAPGMDIPQAPPRASVRDEVKNTAPAQSAEAAVAGSGVAGGRAMAALARDSASGLAPDRAVALGKSSASENQARMRVQLRAAGVSPAPAGLAAPVPSVPAAKAAMPSGLSGDWRGESTCAVRVPVCEDEPVVYHVIGSPSGYQMVMNRLRGTVEEYTALLECVLTPEGMDCPGELGVWKFSVAGNEMTGRFVGRDGVTVRVVKVARE